MISLRLHAIVLICFCSVRGFADLSIADPPGANDFVLANERELVAMTVERAEDRAVQRAVLDLAEDLRRVTGERAPLPGNPNPRSIVIGTLGKNKTIDALVAAGKLDTTGVRDQWESYVLQIVKNPLPGVDQALVIAGSDRRGTIYGVYELSEMIGVSPWYWWADVPPRRHAQLALHGDLKKQGPPAVKYRGIFLNDEDWGLRPWASKTFEPEAGNIGPKTYAKIFELLLRLRANYIWPAMHEGTPAFNSFPTNKEIADAYGIVMGSSHCEQMLRDNVDEWHRDGQGEYNYVVNRDGVLKYWEQRVRENGKFENVYTVGMRGIHDGAMPGGGTDREKAERLHHIIADQRELLARCVNTNVAQVPQIFCPYKEVLPLYRLAPDIPEDITLVWPDDNYGYIRQFSNERERRRSGGAGVYYHLSYWGAPSDYLWLATTSPALICEEMSKAWEYGARTLWVVNVGDLKPCEIGMEFFLKLAWDPHRWEGHDQAEFLKDMAVRDFGPEYSDPIPDLLRRYYHLNFQRRPEHMSVAVNRPPFSEELFSCSANGDENETRLSEFHALAERAEAVGESLPAEQRDAYFELVGYPIQAAMLANEKALHLSRYYSYVAQGRASAVEYLEKARLAHEAIQVATKKYNEIAGGKWQGVMSAHPRDLPQFGFPKISPPPIPTGMSLGVQVEGSLSTTGAVAGLQLPEFNRLTETELNRLMGIESIRLHFIDVFNRGDTPMPWKASADVDWIKMFNVEGTNDSRIMVGVDWSRAPRGDELKGTVRITGGGTTFAIAVKAFNPAGENPNAFYVEDNLRVVMSAMAISRVPGKHAEWTLVDGLGHGGILSAIMISPVTAPPCVTPEQILKESPCMKFTAWIRTPGEWKLTVHALPTFSVEAGRGPRCALSWDGAPPKIISFPTSTSERDRQWQENVLRNDMTATTTTLIEHPGVHTLNVWMVDPDVVIDRIVADRGP
jgi:hypothetical protein